MKNKEKYNLNDFEVVLINGEVTIKQKDKNDATLFEGSYRSFIDWLESEYIERIYLTKAEKVILENINNIYQWIGRNYDGELMVFEEKPYRDEYNDLIARSGSWECFEMFGQIFDDIGKDEFYHIGELLENCEIVDE